jgi:glutamyl-tRNA reductase
MMYAWALKVEPSAERELLVCKLRNHSYPILVLDTCQRLEVYAPAPLEDLSVPVLGAWRDGQAIERLARIAAGLESRILGELEILGQVREAYKAFRMRADGDHARMDRFLQDALSLARKARRQSGIDQQMTSLSGLAARELLQRIRPGDPIAVVGSGSLASSVTRYLGKRGSSPIRVSSRCPENAMELALTVGGFGTGLNELSHLLHDVQGIISATAAPHPVIYPNHLAGARTPLHIIDLGVPPDCSRETISLPHVQYVSLEEIEGRAKGNAEERQRRAAQAATLIRDGALAWSRQN